MNRPYKSKYMYEKFDDIGTYMKDLEKYCDYLEDIVEDNKVAWKDLRKDYRSLERALDKACDKLATMQLEYYSTVNDDLSTKEQWREWALNDDE